MEGVGPSLNLFDEEDDSYKILIIGPISAGKTSLITQYVHGFFPEDPDYRKLTFNGRCTLTKAVVDSGHVR